MSTMAAATYNEVFNTITQADGTIVPETSKMDPMFHWDNHFPDRISRLSITPDYAPPPLMHTPGGGGGGSRSRREAMKNRRSRCAARFKTQPITFDEIKEVDEESGPPPKQDDTKENLKSQFTTFSRSMDGLVASPFSKTKADSASNLLGVSPLAAGATTLPQKADTSEADTGESDQDATNKASQAQSAALQRQQFRQRRKKRHTKSIEEAPELDRIENIDT